MSVDYPKFHPKYQLHLTPDAIFLISEHHDLIFDHPVMLKLAPLLNGQHSVEKIKQLLSDQIKPQTIEQTLQQLANNGYLANVENQQDLVKELMNQPKRHSQLLLSGKSFAVHSLAGIELAALSQTLTQLGAFQQSSQSVIDGSESVTLLIVLTNDYLHPALIKLNQQMLKLKQNWLIAKPLGEEIWVGPVFNATSESACWQCLAHRLSLKARAGSWLALKNLPQIEQQEGYLQLPQAVHLAPSMLGLEIARFLQGNNKLVNQLLSFDLIHYQNKMHPVTARGICPICHPQQANVHFPSPIKFNPQLIATNHCGGQRIQSAHATLDAMAPHIDEITGVMEPLEEVYPEHEELIYSYMASHAFSTNGNDIQQLVRRLGVRAGGKGETRAQAKASVVGEAAERYSGLFQGNEYQIQKNYLELVQQAVDPNLLMGFSEQQQVHREQWNQNASPKQRVSAPFDPELRLSWTPVWSITKHTFKYLPTGYLYYAHPESEEHRMFWADSNGMAAGNCLEEAVLQGLLEVVERDAVAMWWFHRIQRQGIDLESFDEPYVQKVRAYYDKYQRTLELIELTNDLEIPVVAAISADKELGTRVIYGFGAHLDWRIAILRAIIEVNQSFPIISSPKRLQNHRWWQEVNFNEQTWLQADRQKEMLHCAKLIKPVNPHLVSSIQQVISAIERKGLEVLVLDQSRADLPLQVVKVVVPHMRHFWRRLRPGRLFDVPLQMGWIHQLYSQELEASLNPWDIYF